MDQEQIQKLLEKAKAGTLSAEEKELIVKEFNGGLGELNEVLKKMIEAAKNSPPAQ